MRFVSGVESSFSAAAVAAAATERALERLLRGATWQAITREIAWRAVAEAGGGHDLGRNFGCVAGAPAVRAWRGHLRWRPHDHAGAELAAAIEAREEAQQLVVAAYAQVCRD